LKALTIK